MLGAPVAIEPRRPDLRDLIDLRVQPRGLEVKSDKLIGQSARSPRVNVRDLAGG
jgi:hypothetical protein